MDFIDVEYFCRIPENIIYILYIGLHRGVNTYFMLYSTEKKKKSMSTNNNTECSIIVSYMSEDN